MELNPNDIGRIREAAPDAVLRCEECRRILVRTPESGL
jgi:predicted  nucleic acid-binding Zn-ribbon protein